MRRYLHFEVETVQSGSQVYREPESEFRLLLPNLPLPLNYPACPPAIPWIRLDMGKGV